MWPGNNKFCCNGRLMFGKDLNSFCVSNVLIAVPVLLFLLLRLTPRRSPYAFSLRVSSFVFHLPAGIVCADSSSRPFSVLHSGCDVALRFSIPSHSFTGCALLPIHLHPAHFLSSNNNYYYFLNQGIWSRRAARPVPGGVPRAHRAVRPRHALLPLARRPPRPHHRPVARQAMSGSVSQSVSQ